MAKMVTERPRYGHANKSLKTHRRLSKKELSSDMEDFDSGPKNHPVSASRQHGYDAKEFSDLLGPLKNYLRKQVGRPWDNVHSELCKTLDNRSLSGRHIWTHVWQFVEVDVMMIDRKPWSSVVRYGHRYKIRGLYVHPKTGLLCWIKK